MAEVKSTLELVMERTRHLTLTEEDKRKQALAEFTSGVGGLLQKVRDGVLRPERFKDDLRVLQERMPLSGTAIFIEELSSRLDLDGDNVWALQLLTEAFSVDTEELADVFRDYRQALERPAQVQMEALRQKLHERHGIRGAAVIPNWTADSEWAAEHRRLRDHFALALKEAMGRLKLPDHPGACPG